MPESICLGGHGTYSVFPVQEHNEAISRENFSEVVRLWWCALITHCAHSFFPNSIPFFLPLPIFLSFVCSPAFHMLSLSLCLNPYNSSTALSLSLSLSLSLCLSHSLPHMVMLVLAKPVCWLVWVGVLVCVSLACSLTLTATHVLFADYEPRLTPWRQRAGDGNEEAERDFQEDEMDSFTAAACWVFTQKEKNTIVVFSWLYWREEVHNYSMTMQCCSQHDHP